MLANVAVSALDELVLGPSRPDLRRRRGHRALHRPVGDGRGGAVVADQDQLEGVPLAEQSRVQALLGQAAARLDAARALLLTTVGTLDTAAASRRPASEAERGDVRGAMCRAVLTSMYEAGGSTSLYESSLLARPFRDGHTAAQHAILSPASYDLVGRTVIGLPARDPSL